MNLTQVLIAIKHRFRTQLPALPSCDPAAIFLRERSSTRSHLRQNVVAYVALFVALGTGTAFVVDQLVKSKDIARSAVKAKHSKVVAQDFLTGALGRSTQTTSATASAWAPAPAPSSATT